MTNYEKILQEMNPEKMATDRVKMILVNQAEPFYMTSRGQLYNFDNLRGAIIDEYNWLISNIPEDNNAKAEESNAEPEDVEDNKNKKSK